MELTVLFLQLKDLGVCLSLPDSKHYYSHFDYSEQLAMHYSDSH